MPNNINSTIIMIYRSPLKWWISVICIKLDLTAGMIDSRGIPLGQRDIRQKSRMHLRNTYMTLRPRQQTIHPTSEAISRHIRHMEAALSMVSQGTVIGEAEAEAIRRVENKGLLTAAPLAIYTKEAVQDTIIRVAIEKNLQETAISKTVVLRTICWAKDLQKKYFNFKKLNFFLNSRKSNLKAPLSPPPK